MSIDIYFMFQARRGDSWQDIPCEFNGFHGGRDQALFAWLALGGGDDKNSYSIEPLAKPRGFPEDFALVDQVFHPIADIELLAEEKRGYFQKRDMRVLMGHADFSYYLAYEILKAEPPKALRAMAVPIAQYQQWDRRGTPAASEPVPRGWKRHPSYAGRGYAAPDEIDAATSFVVTEVEYSFSGEIAWFRDLLERLGEEHGKVRFVFGFA
ncbi:MAG: hypothetical protein JO002_02540 [Burkholderiaceae bacterium]|nr:hypothetical protein [Burkholderiaceae bacterium]